MSGLRKSPVLEPVKIPDSILEIDHKEKNESPRFNNLRRISIESENVQTHLSKMLIGGQKSFFAM